MERIENVDLSMPAVKLPRYDIITLALFLLTSLPMAGVLAYIFLAHPSPGLSLTLGFFVSLPCLFFNFSVIHEAAHRNVSQNRRFNDWVGRVGAFWLLGSFRHFRWVHLEHHAHVNKEGLDPDLHASGGPNLLRWCFTSLHYFIHVCKHARRSKLQWSDFIPYVLAFTLVGHALFSGKVFAVLVVWVVPSLLAVGLMVLCFDYLPHRPHKETLRYKASAIRILPYWAEAIFMGQNLHLIHHLWPSIPWHKYREAFEQKKYDLQKVGAPIIRGFEDRHSR